MEVFSAKSGVILQEESQFFKRTLLQYSKQKRNVTMRVNIFTVGCAYIVLLSLFCFAVNGEPETAADRSRNLRQRRLRNRQRRSGSQTPRAQARPQIDNLDPDVCILFSALIDKYFLVY